jgi:hypothetical protein
MILDKIYLNNPPELWESMGKDIGKGIVCWFALFLFPIILIIYLFQEGSLKSGFKDMMETFCILIFCIFLVIMGFIVLIKFRKSDDWKIEFKYDRQFYDKIYTGLIKMLKEKKYDYKIDERSRDTGRRKIEIDLEILPSLEIIYGTKNEYERNPIRFYIYINNTEKNTLMHAHQLAREINYILKDSDYEKYIVSYGKDKKK